SAVFPLSEQHQLLQAVRELQRCRHISRWPAYTTRFRRRLDVIADGSPTAPKHCGTILRLNWLTFNQIFLGNRTNKSAYRLVLILAHEWFQYYQAWPATKRVNHDALDMASEAYRVWSSSNAIQETQRSEGVELGMFARLPKVVR
ncbi:hypothetical protein B0H14DRAFT_3054875, partial [Mycena olivaceomarginata]